MMNVYINTWARLFVHFTSCEAFNLLQHHTNMFSPGIIISLMRYKWEGLACPPSEEVGRGEREEEEEELTCGVGE